jgi:predicted alpha/beta superfamily hydrolase
MIQQLSQVNGNTICPEMIVVGITNTDRTRDLTPTHIVDDPPFMDSTFSKTSGGGEQFVSFIQKELMPHIDSLYPTAPYKMLIGHSFGGLTVINIAINHTKLFNSYISIDPSMWWDKMNFLKATKKSIAEKNFSGTAFFLGIANTMDESMDITKVQSDTSDNTRHIRSILDLDKYIKGQKQNGLKYESKYYSNDDHGSVLMIAEYDGLRFIFEKYRLKLSFKDFTDSTFDLANKFEQHYQEVSKQFGYKVSPPENMVNGLAYELLNRKQYAKAGKLFKMNVDNYPESFNVYDSYGDYFLAIGDKSKAIEYFKKALTLKENPESRKKLNNLLE